MLFLLHDHVLTTVTMNTLETMHPQSQGSKKKKKSVGSSPQKEICFRPELNDKHNIILEICGQSEFLFAGIQPQQNI